MGSPEPQRVRRFEAPNRDKPGTVRVWLLGGFRVSAGSTTVEEHAWRLKKAAALVKLLALAPGHRLHREQLMDLLWPGLGRKAASNNLRQALHAARKALDPAEGSRYLSSKDERLVLCPEDDLWTDVAAFEEATAAARRAKDPATYRAAIDLYAGELLPEDRYEEWTESRRQDLRRSYLSLLVESAALYEERGEHERGIEVLRRAVEEERTLEEAHAGLMRLYALVGREGEAVAQYERLRATLSRELGAEPSAHTRRLRGEIAAGRFPLSQFVGQLPGEPSDAGEHNLPALRTSFVAREHEIVELKRELAMTRLLTLTGTGGSGKTRLALEVARDLAGTYPDGVWWTELAPLAEADLVVGAVAGALGLQEQPGVPLGDTLTETLRGKRTLLVLDNCEHVVDAVASLIDDLLNACPALRILTTSREPLGVMGESVRHVSPLSVPPTDRPPVVLELLRYDAVRLFLVRARLRLPGFDLTSHNATAVAEVCRRLEGIPLAVELAAARVGTLPVDEVCRRLRDSLGLLSGGPRTAPYRQRTMRATLDWSYGLLSEEEKRLLRLISVFAGGWTLDAAEAIGSGGGIRKASVLELLLGLTEKSLVMVNTTGEPAPRYGMLEPIRQYLREKLGDGGETQDIRRLHAAFFQKLAEEAELKLQGPEEAEWIGRLASEHDNLNAALSWALGGGDSTLGIRLAGALPDYWVVRGHVSEGMRWIEEALTVVDDTAEPASRAATLNAAGFFWAEKGDFQRAEACLGEAVALRRDLGDPLRLSDTLANLGWLADSRGDHRRAMAFFEESLETARVSNHPRARAGALNGLGWTAANSGDFDRARRLWEESAAVNRDVGYHSGVGMAFINMGLLEVALGNLGQATTVLEKALALGRRLGNKYVVQGSFLTLGLAETLGGDPKRGRALLVDALNLAAEAGRDPDTVENLEGLALAAGELGQHARAARLWGAAVAFRRTGHQWSPMEQMLYAPLLDAARSQTEVSVWEAAFAEGKAMGLKEAVAYALSEEAATTQTAADRPSSSQSSCPLTQREEEVAALVAQGLTNRQLSTELSISERTASNHVARILRKLGLRSRAQIVSWVTEHKLPDPDRD
jgi:predicted ATPase/DNA-binding SARP family transcriptional activator/DNA-binding CsgD family transcriptional regulator